MQSTKTLDCNENLFPEAVAWCLRALEKLQAFSDQKIVPYYDQSVASYIAVLVCALVRRSYRNCWKASRTLHCWAPDLDPGLNLPQLGAIAMLGLGILKV